MQYWWIIPVVLMAAGAALAAAIVWRKLPQLSVLDVQSIPEEKNKKMKEQLILQRFERLAGERFGRVGKAATGGVRSVSKAGRRMVQRLYRLEQSYQKMRKAPAKHAAATSDPEAIKRLLSEADEMTRAEEFIQAEKKYIEVISHDPKNVDAYEGLGNLYIRSKQYGQAREALQFTLRISPDDASVRMSLADVALLEGHPETAVEHLRLAVAKRPGNPKYLDAYIEASFAAGNAEDARKGIKLLKEANPENQKLADFEARARELAANAGKPDETPSEPSQTAR
jgi:tetratricopeptide (TPR) repeat protein